MNINKAIAVYGTLRTGQPLAHVWEGAATATTGVVTGFGLVVKEDLAYPIAKWTGRNDDVIVVEVLKFKSEKVFKRVLTELDLIEGHPLLYRRQRVTVNFRLGSPLGAYMYIGADPRMFLDGAILEDGDWVEFTTGLPTVFE